jgi:hypothetical protein
MKPAHTEAEDRVGAKDNEARGLEEYLLSAANGEEGE